VERRMIVPVSKATSSAGETGTRRHSVVDELID
jgi:hypothetical protein